MENKANRSQFGPWEAGPGIRAVALYTMAPNKANFPFYGLKMRITMKNKATQSQWSDGSVEAVLCPIYCPVSGWDFMSFSAGGQ